MSNYVKSVAACAFIVLVTLVWVPPVVGQGEPGARGQAGGRGRGGPPAPPVPPMPQAGHPTGKLVIWGDLADFTRPGPVLRCYTTSRFKRGQRAGFRMTAVDGGSGEVENTAEMTIHLSYKGATIDIPMRWRGNQPFPPQEYLHAPLEMWTGVWEVPEDAPIGTLSYTITATDRFGRTATFNPFPNHLSQLAVVE